MQPTQPLNITYPLKRITLSFMEYKMYVHKEELRIIDLFRRNLLKEFTLREIMAKLGKKSYNWTYKAINRMSSSAMLTAQKKGKTTVLRANLNSPDLITHLMQLDKEDAYKNSIPLADELIDKIAAKTPFFILLVVGSYATGQQTKKSDVDAVIIVPDRRKTEELKPYIAEI